ERRPGERQPRPDAEADELPAAAVLLGHERQARRAEQAAARLEVPAVEVAAGLDRGAVGAAALLEDREPVARVDPALAPERDRPGPREGEADAGPPPRRQAVVEPSPQPH